MKSAYILVVLGVLLTSCKAPVVIPPPLPAGYIQYCAESDTGAWYMFALPAQFKVVKTDVRDEFDFVADNHDTLYVPIAGNLTGGRSDTKQSVLSSSDPSSIDRKQDGSVTTWSVNRFLRDGKPWNQGLAFWFFDNSAISISLKSQEPKAEAEKEIKQIIETVFYSPYTQTDQEIGKVFKHDVFFLKRPIINHND